MIDEIKIVPFRAEDQEAAKKLVLAGLAEHWGELDLSKNPDLNDIATTYANGIFLVAWLGGEIVGTGALVQRREGQAEIVRMSVARKMRRRGVGRQILQKLIDWAREKGYERVVLETTVTWSEVVAFYLQYGFHITHYQDGDVYFALELVENA
jgi:GNAT superfamily N-acetyltransferase